MKRYVWTALIFSLLFHLAVLGFFRWLEPEIRARHEAIQNPLPKISIPTRLVTERELGVIVESASNGSPPLIAPKDPARYQGERTQRVEKETRAANFGSVQGDARLRNGNADSLRPNPRESLWRVPLLDYEKEIKDNKKRGLARGSMDALAPEISIGTQTLLNTDENVYASFFNRIKREVAPRWEPTIQKFLRTTFSLSDGTYVTRYAFFVDEAGVVKNTELLRSSGSAELDRLAMQALLNVGTFHNPPDALRGKDGLGRIEMGFMVEYSKRSYRSDYLPDPRFMAR